MALVCLWDATSLVYTQSTIRTLRYVTFAPLGAPSAPTNQPAYNASKT